MGTVLKLLAAVGALVLSLGSADAGTTGVLLLHGKTGMPSQMMALAGALKSAGYIVGRPEMCWSKRRIYDHDLSGCLADIDSAIGRLKGEGATSVVLGGTSLGAMAALTYAATHDNLIGVVAIVPASDPLDPAPFPAFAASLKKARDLIKAGKGDEPTALTDIVTGGTDVALNVSPALFESFHGPDSPMSTVVNGLEKFALPKIRVPVLWVAGTRDPSQSIAPEAFTKIPANPLSKFVRIDADHAGASDAAGPAVTAWLATLGGP